MYLENDRLAKRNEVAEYGEGLTGRTGKIAENRAEEIKEREKKVSKDH